MIPAAERPPLTLAITTQDGQRCDSAAITDDAWPAARVAALLAFVRYADAHPEMRLGQAMCEMGYCTGDQPSVYYVTDAQLAKAVP